MILKVVIGIPAFNEEKNIAKIIVKLQKISDAIIVCNDGSTDLTKEISEKMGVEVINHPKNLGYGAGIRSIFLKASKMDTDIVIGSRFLKSETNENVPKYRKVGIKVITKITDSVTDLKLTDSQSGFRAYKNNVLKEIIPSDKGMGVSTEILIKASKRKFKVKEVPIKILYEGDTSTHNPVSHGTSVVLSTMKYASIEHPLKFYGIPGVIFLAIGLFFVLWTLQSFSETRQIITNISLIGIGSVILGTMLSMTAIMLYSLVSVVRERNNG